MIIEIFGITPEASTLRSKTSAYPASEATPSWMRAPPESLRPMTGAPTFIAWSMILQIFSACGSPLGGPEHGEILAEHEHQLAVDRAVAGDDAVARDLVLLHREIVAAVLDEHVPFLKG